MMKFACPLQCVLFCLGRLSTIQCRISLCSLWPIISQFQFQHMCLKPCVVD
jgi:hypothetical protein